MAEAVNGPVIPIVDKYLKKVESEFTTPLQQSLLNLKDLKSKIKKGNFNPDLPSPPFHCNITYSTIFGVNRNGTGRLASNSPVASSTSNLK